MTDEKIETVDVGPVEVGEPEQVDPAQALFAENQALADECANLGRPISQIDELSLAVQILVDMLLYPGSPFRHIYDMQRLISMNNYLKDAASKARQAKLTDGVQMQMGV